MKYLWPLLIVISHAHAAPATMNGAWEGRWSCDQHGWRCPEGEDVFRLDLRTRGEQVCGKLIATWRGASKVEEDADDEPPSVVGRYLNHSATVSFKSNWGGRGVASIELRGDALHWKVLWQDDGESYLPQEAVMHSRANEGRFLWREFACPQ